MIVDSHCHASDKWYEPVETLLDAMDRNAVDAAVLVQMLGDYEHAYMLEAARRYPGRFVVVAGVRIERDDACENIRRAADAGLAGVRLRPGGRSPGTDPLALWRCLEELRLPISCVGKAADFTSPDFTALVKALPGVPIVLEHLGGLARPDVGDRSKMAEAVLELAQYPNVHLKLPGLGQLAPRMAELDPRIAMPLQMDGVMAFIDHIITAFSERRIMWGSDFPPVASREGYANALEWTRLSLGHHPASTLRSIFGETARRVFFQD